MQNPTTPQSILVTGGAGFIGSNFVEDAVDQGNRVIVLDAMTYAGHRENLDLIRNKKQVELVIGNIGDSNLVGAILKDHDIDAVINFAAESHVDRSIDGPSVFIETNINGTFNLLNASLT